MVEENWLFGGGENSSRQAWRRGLLSAGALLLALMMAGLLYLVAQSNSERDAAADRERRSYEIIMLTRAIEGARSRSEAALGRFVINSDRRLGTIYRDEWRIAGRQIGRLEQLLDDRPEQLELTRQVGLLYDQYGRELSRTASYANARRNWEALSLHNETALSSAGAGITSTLDRIADNERARLAELSAARIETTEKSNLLATLLTIAGVILGIVALALAWATVRAFRDRHRADQRADELEEAVSQRTAELETLNAELRAEVTERVAAEQKLRQAQKLEAVGRLTGGIAHDFNNMLSVVVGGIDLARRKLDDDDDAIRRHLDNAADGADRAAALTRRLLAFARSEPLLPAATDPAELVDQMAGLIERTIGERIEVSIDCETDCWPVWVDPRQLESAIVNLAVNGRDAMDGTGAMRIAVANCPLDDRQINELPAGDYVRIAVSDDGCGMGPEVIERVFEPFFTTKEVGKGTGLGMSQIFGFARQSGGDVGIDSTVGEGTTVSIYLPRHGGAVQKASADAGSLGPEAGERHIAGHTILVVEDDPRVLRATSEALEELQCAVIPCDGAQAALAALSGSQPIDLLLTDVVMPDMTGPELVAHIAPDHPDLPVVFVTGYVGEGGELDQLENRMVLRKPFTMAELAEAIRTALRERTRSQIAAE